MKEDIPTYDLAVRGGFILNPGDDPGIIPESLVLVKNGIIDFAGPLIKAPAYKADKIISANGKYVMPPFFNQHTHLSPSLYRGLGTDLHLHDWLNQVIWPLEKKYCNPDNVYLGTVLSLIESIKSGTGTLANMDFHNASAGKALSQAGIRGLLGEGLFDEATPSSNRPDDTFLYTEQLIKDYKDNDLISLYLAPHAPFSCSPVLYEKTGELARKWNIPVGTHLCETIVEVDNIKSKYGLSPVELLDRTGVFDHHLVAYHGIHIDEKDIEILYRKDVSVVHNPHSNMALGSGICRVPELLSRGIRVGLGTDSASSNNHLSMLRELQTAYLIHKGVNRDPALLPARTVLHMAGAAGYEIYRMEDLGRLAEGFKADLMIMDLNSSHNLPVIDPFGSIVSSSHSNDVISLMVNGRMIMEDRKLLTLDEDLYLKEARIFGDRVKQDFPKMFKSGMKETGYE